MYMYIYISVPWKNLNEFSPITLAHAIVSDYHMWDSIGNDHIQTA